MGARDPCCDSDSVTGVRDLCCGVDSVMRCEGSVL